MSGQGLSQETQMQSKNRLSSNQVTRKLRLTREKSKEKNTPNPKIEDVMRKITLWHGVNHNRNGMTAEINSNPKYAI
jgi:hypothetical protein